MSGTWTRRLLVGVGVACVVLAGLVLLPGGGPLGAVRAVTVDAVAGVPRAALGWSVTLGAGCYAVVRLYRARARPSSPPRFAFEADPGSGAGPGTAGRDGDEDRRTVGTAFGSTVRRATVGMSDPTADGGQVRSRLRATAVEAVHRDADGPTDRAGAERAVRRGEWTDDPVAAAFLADGDGPDHPLPARLRGWLRPDAAFCRRVDRTVAAIHERSAASGRLDRSDAVAERATHDGDTGGADAGGGDGDDTAAGDGDRGVPAPDGGERETADASRVVLDRWSGGLAAAAALVAAGVLAGSSVLVATAAVPVVFAARGALTRVDVSPAALRVERRVEPTAALPGDRVRVRLRVHNEGRRTATDLRVVDGVPDALRVVDGTPRKGVSLAPGESATVEYTLLARRGHHDLGPVGVRVRGLTGGEVAAGTVAAAGDGRLDCRPDVDVTPALRRTLRAVGAVDAPTGGDGVEFHATREYRRGDPVSRVDWRRFARTGDLTTVEFREQRTARTVVLVDGRRPAGVAPRADAPTAATVCAGVARQLFDAVRGSGQSVGAAALGVAGETGLTPGWVPPAGDEETRLRAHRLFDRAAEAAAAGPVGAGPVGPAGAARPDGGRRPAPDGGGVRQSARRSLGRLCERLPGATRLLFVTPALDAGVTAAVRTATANDVAVTVVSPDVTHGDGTGARFAAVERAHRLEACREAGARVVDWTRDEPLALALAAALGGVR